MTKLITQKNVFQTKKRKFEINVHFLWFQWTGFSNAKFTEDEGSVGEEKNYVVAISKTIIKILAGKIKIINFDWNGSIMELFPGNWRQIHSIDGR